MKLPPPEFIECLKSEPKLLNIGSFIHGNRSFRQWKVPHFQFNLHMFHGELVLNGKTQLMLKPGTVTIIPPNQLSEYHYHGPSPCLWVHFTLEEEITSKWNFPPIIDLGSESEQINYMIEEALSVFSIHPKLTTIQFWCALWHIAGQIGHEVHTLSSDTMPPRLQRILQHIELHLDLDMPANELAVMAGISHNHLIRLFRKHTGQNIVGYIRQRRVRRALHLLKNSSAPALNVALSCGFKDIHRLNKAVKQETGKPPSQHR